MTAKPKDAGRNRSRNSRDGAKVWVTGTLELITQDGVDALKIEKLSRSIGVSKGSFYWFFEDLNDLLMCSLFYWKDELNHAIFKVIKQAEGTVQERLSLLIDVIYDTKIGRHDAAIRAWSVKDEIVSAIVSDVDLDRLCFLTELFVEDGSEQSDAEQKAHLLYRAIISESYLSHYPESTSNRWYLKDLIAVLLAGGSSKTSFKLGHSGEKQEFET